MGGSQRRNPPGSETPTSSAINEGTTKLQDGQIPTHDSETLRTGPQFKHKPVHFRRTPDDRVRQLLQFFATKKRQKAKDRPNQKFPWRPVTPPAKCRAILVETKHAYREKRERANNNAPVFAFSKLRYRQTSSPCSRQQRRERKRPLRTAPRPPALKKPPQLQKGNNYASS